MHDNIHNSPVGVLGMLRLIKLSKQVSKAYTVRGETPVTAPCTKRGLCSSLKHAKAYDSVVLNEAASQWRLYSGIPLYPVPDTDSNPESACPIGRFEYSVETSETLHDEYGCLRVHLLYRYMNRMADTHAWKWVQHRVRIAAATMLIAVDEKYHESVAKCSR